MRDYLDCGLADQGWVGLESRRQHKQRALSRLERCSHFSDRVLQSCRRLKLGNCLLNWNLSELGIKVHLKWSHQNITTNYDTSSHYDTTVAFRGHHLTLSPALSAFTPTISIPSFTTTPSVTVLCLVNSPSLLNTSMSRPSPVLLSDIISKLPHLNCPSDLLFSDPVDPGHSLSEDLNIFISSTSNSTFCLLNRDTVSKSFFPRLKNNALNQECHLGSGPVQS